jgi:hypothetical protein
VVPIKKKKKSAIATASTKKAYSQGIKWILTKIDTDRAVVDLVSHDVYDFSGLGLKKN